LLTERVRLASYIQPNSDKSLAQNTQDTITPGNDSSVKAEGEGITGAIANMATGAKDAVANALGGQREEPRA